MNFRVATASLQDAAGTPRAVAGLTVACRASQSPCRAAGTRLARRPGAQSWRTAGSAVPAPRSRPCPLPSGQRGCRRSVRTMRAGARRVARPRAGGAREAAAGRAAARSSPRPEVPPRGPAARPVRPPSRLRPAFLLADCCRRDPGTAPFLQQMNTVRTAKGSGRGGGPSLCKASSSSLRNSVSTPAGTAARRSGVQWKYAEYGRGRAVARARSGHSARARGGGDRPYISPLRTSSFWCSGISLLKYVHRVVSGVAGGTIDTPKSLSMMSMTGCGPRSTPAWALSALCGASRQRAERDAPAGRTLPKISENISPLKRRREAVLQTCAK